jgi:hypothetical protein
MGSKERRGAPRVQRRHSDGPMEVLRLVVELGRGRSSGLRREGGGAATGQGCGDTAGLGEEIVSGLRGDGVWQWRRTSNGAGTPPEPWAAVACGHGRTAEGKRRHRGNNRADGQVPGRPCNLN